MLKNDITGNAQKLIYVSKPPHPIKTLHEALVGATNFARNVNQCGARKSELQPSSSNFGRQKSY